MNRNDYNHATAEISFLEGIASQPGLNFLTAKSVEARLRKAREKQAKAQTAARVLPAKVVLTYRGAPVRGSFGVVADFGTSATRAFNEAVRPCTAFSTSALKTQGSSINILAKP